MKILITKSEHDLETFYLSKWIEKVKAFAENRNIRSICLERYEANRENAENMLKNISFNLVIFNGHGTDEEICGHNNETLIKSGENDFLLKSKIIYSIACESAKKLGVEAVKNGAVAFIGYDQDFIIYTNTNMAAKPLEDEFVKSFLESSNKIGVSLIKGLTTKEAFEESQKSFERWILYYLKNDLIESPFILPALIWDMSCQSLIGNESARL